MALRDYGALLASARQEWEAASDACFRAAAAPSLVSDPDSGIEYARLERAISALVAVAEEFVLSATAAPESAEGWH